MCPFHIEVVVFFFIMLRKNKHHPTKMQRIIRNFLGSLLWLKNIALNSLLISLIHQYIPIKCAQPVRLIVNLSIK